MKHTRAFIVQGIQPKLRRQDVLALAAAQESVFAWANLYLDTHGYSDHWEWIQSVFDTGCAQMDFAKQLWKKFGGDKEKVKQYVFLYALYEKL
ncbi:hypothetical protein PQX77_021604 [Marasmius sp. AFHP31]|nr:hypothetical protein PQX77_021604 [Marasmius sp. AFHP31]